MLEFLTNNAGPLLLVLFLATSGLAVWNVMLLRQLRGRQAHHDELLQAVENEGVEGLLTKQARDITRLSHDVEELYKQGEVTQQRLDGALTKIGVLRFNPFGDAGGNQSFVCALLDARGSGLVISSLHHRSGNRIYAKPIKENASEFPLSTEEQQAIRQAMEGRPAQVGLSTEAVEALTRAQA